MTSSSEQSGNFTANVNASSPFVGHIQTNDNNIALGGEIERLLAIPISTLKQNVDK